MQNDLSGTGIGMITVGFSPPRPLRELAAHLGLTGAMLSDEHRSLYRLLGLRRAPLWQVYSPGTLTYYALARLRGRELRRPVEDTRQLGGDAIVADGTIVRRWMPRSPDDRVPPAHLVAAARAAARR